VLGVLLALRVRLRHGRDAIALPPRAAAWPALLQGAAAPRVLPHVVVLGLVAAALAAGGFSRPDRGFEVPMGTEDGTLSAHGRFVLGPRAAEVQVRDALVRPALSVTTGPLTPRAEAISYVVKPGDTIWDIGLQFKVGSHSVLWSNGLDESAIIRPGQELRIPPVRGTLHLVAAGDSLDSIAKKYNVDPAAIVDFNALRPGEGLEPDKVLVVPGGELPIEPRIPAAPAIRPPAAPLDRPSVPVPAPRPSAPAPPAPAQRAQPAPRPSVPVPAPPVSPVTGRLAWPTRGVITTYFSGWHPGLDIAARLGTAIGAADGGTVTFTGWDSTGYGYRVIISHGNGYTTTYNHLSTILVRAGQVVGKGQTIGGMGSTGRSTGSHLHFEILVNGRFVNPLAVLN
jgi:murein DD-endopeptidase MepM/ murein hydrolase activator NlpD